MSYLKNDKLYFFAFIITIVFIFTSSFHKIRTVDYNKDKLENEVVSEPVVDTLSIQDYVGIYSRVVSLDDSVVINNLCEIDSYKIVYQIKKDSTINKYFYNSCIGSALISTEVLDYLYNGSSRFIGTENYSYQFGTNYLKEIDGYSYYIDEDLFSIKESLKVNDINLYFYGDNVLFLTNDDLILENDSKVVSVSSIYPSKGGDLNRRFYPSLNKYQFNFIVFNRDDNLSCTSEIESDEIAYKVYSIRFDVNSNNFLDAKEVVSRTKSDGCEFYQEDLKKLEE